MQDYEHVPLQIVGFGFGASFVALFAQLGGGIYTKAADVGADLVGKVEAGIPEDDPRNPAVIADLVGDNVGDCAGRGADLFESTAAENVGAMILGIALYPVFGMGGILFPLLARAFGLIATIVGVFSVKCREDEDPMNALNRGYLVTTVLAMAGFAAAVYLLLKPVAGRWRRSARATCSLAGVIGILTAYAFVWITQYYTEYKYRPVRSIAEASRTGPATNIISGLAVGFECTGLPVLVISAALMGAYWCGKMALGDIPGAGLYGTAIATMGMLAPCAYILAMDTFGPITDNAGGIIEMSKQPEEIRHKTDRLDAVGNTTKALTKGYAIGSAALAAFLLFSAYLDEVRKITGQHIEVDLTRVPVFVGGLLGATLVFVFSALAIKAVGKAAQVVIGEVRRQFKENPGIMAGHGQARLRALRGHRDRRRAARDGGARPPRRAHAGGGGLRLPLPLALRPDGRGVGGRPAHGGHDHGHPHGHGHEQRRRGLGQRQEVHRVRRVQGGRGGGGQELRAPQGGGRGRHRGRPLQGHGGAVAARADQAALHDHAGAGAALHRLGAASGRNPCRNTACAPSLGTAGAIVARAGPTASTHLILDVNGYFE